MTATARSGEALCSALRELSFRIGRNPELTQANTGNTSIKQGGTLWIKASGYALANAYDPEAFLEADLEEAQRGLWPPGASIETSMHALLNWRVVLHVHSLNAVAWSLREGARPELARRLSGLNWAWVPYADSGMPLGRAVERASRELPSAQVFLLANHGVAIGADDCAEAEELLEEVEHRLRLAPRELPPVQPGRLKALLETGDWRLPGFPVSHALALDPTGRSALSGRPLYPCQVIFLQPHLFRAVEGAGVVVSRRIGLRKSEILAGLAEITRRIPEEWSLRRLTRDEVARIATASYLK